MKIKLSTTIICALLLQTTLIGIACEEYLKCLLQKQNKLIKHSGHDLKKLFSTLPKTQQNNLKKQIAADDDFDSKFSNIKNSFTTWRYPYEIEESEINLDFLRKFCALLRLECEIELEGMV